MSPAADPPLSSATMGGVWKVACRGTAGINPAWNSTWSSKPKSRGGQMSPAADPPLSSATMGGVWKVACRGTAGINPAWSPTSSSISTVFFTFRGRYLGRHPRGGRHGGYPPAGRTPARTCCGAVGAAPGRRKRARACTRRQACESHRSPARLLRRLRRADRLWRRVPWDAGLLQCRMPAWRFAGARLRELRLVSACEFGRRHSLHARLSRGRALEKSVRPGSAPRH